MQADVCVKERQSVEAGELMQHEYKQKGMNECLKAKYHFVHSFGMLDRLRVGS